MTTSTRGSFVCKVDQKKKTKTFFKYESYHRGKGGYICFDDKRLVVFLSGMEKPPTFCHLSNASHNCVQHLYREVVLTTVPWRQRLGEAAAWLPWPDPAWWNNTASELTYGNNRHMRNVRMLQYIQQRLFCPKKENDSPLWIVYLQSLCRLNLKSVNIFYFWFQIQTDETR